MNIAEKIIRNKSKARRVLLLKKLQYQIRTLKRRRYCQGIINNKIGNEYALETTIKEIINFLDCSFNDIVDPEITRCVTNFKKSLNGFSAKIQHYRDIDETIPARVLKPCTVSMRKLYQASRKNALKLKCDEAWNRVGLSLIVLFNMGSITKN